MKQLKAFKFRLKTNGADIYLLRQFDGCCRLIWNKALALNAARLRDGHKVMWYHEMAFWLAFWKQTEELGFLNDAPSQALQQTLMNLDRAMKDAFNKASLKRFPRFKKKGTGVGIRYPQGFRLDQPNSRIFLPKIGWIRYHNSREIEGLPKSVTVSEHCGHWYVSILTEREVEAPKHPAGSIVGIDVGVAKFAALSDGTVFQPVNSYRKREKALQTAQRRLSHKKRFSRNWRNQQARIQRLHGKIANIRLDFLHKTSTTLCKNHAGIVIEDLKVANMSKSAKGTSEKHGRNVRAKGGLNKSILDQGWSEFRRQVEYKQDWLGGLVVAVNARDTSRTCSVCGTVAAESRETQSRFVCVACGHAENADTNAAKNILNRGMRLIEGQDTADASAGQTIAARIACVVSDAVMSPAAGTRRKSLALA